MTARSIAPLETIPVFAPHIGIDTLKHVTDAFAVGWLGMGSTTAEFERAIATFLETDRHVVATNTGTSALHIACMAAGVKPGDEVITPSFNYVADHQAIQMAGGTAVMCDVRDEDLGFDAAKAESLITQRTKALMPLHFAGIPCDRAGVYDLAKRHDLRVIEDSCHGFGTAVDGKKLGSDGDITVFSFDPVKVATSIDGGCVVTARDDERTSLQHLRLLGVDRDTTERYKNRRAWDYDVVSPGYRYHLTNIMASVGVSQLKRVDEFIASRRAVCVRYNQAFSSLQGVRVPATDFSNVSPFIYSLRVLDGARERLIEHLRERNIDAGIHFIPVHEHSYFRSNPRGDMSVTERAAREVITLPLHSNMRLAFVERVVDGVASFFS
jgi:dTDP-4-amino-4,6-dideoxygalactose transaminase